MHVRMLQFARSLALAAFAIAVGGLLLVHPVQAQTAKATTPQPAATQAVAATAINWLPYDSGIARTRGSNKHMLVDITASWCGWCKKMDRETFTDPKVIELINTHFVPVKLWGDSEKELNIDGYKITEKNLAINEFKVSGFPAFWFLNAKLEKIGPLPGYQTADRMAQVLAYVAEYKYDTTKVKPSEKQAPEGKK